MRAISLLGIFAFPFLAWLLSSGKRRLNGRLILGCIALQLGFAAFVFRSPTGRGAFVMVNDAIKAMVDASMRGPEFLFGRLALGPGSSDPQLGSSLGFFLAFQALPTIIVFSALIAILYHLGIMQLLIRAFAWLFTRLLGISGAESLAASSNLFVGVESALIIRPHLVEMTKSELCTLLTVCMATVASNVMASYVFFLGGIFPGIAGHLVSASILSAPAALLMSKLILPETESPKTLGTHIEPHYERETSLFAAVISGAENGLKLVFGIAALLIAVVGLLGIFNMVVGHLAGCSIETVLAWPFKPLAWLMGVPRDEVNAVATLLGERVVATEFRAYMNLAKLMADPAQPLSPRAATIAAYALCGFSHIPSVAIFVGGISAIVPERKADLARVAWRAFIAATLACLMTGAVAGVMLESQGAILSSAPLGSAVEP